MKLFLFIVMLLILPETYAACTGEITYQDNLIIREDFTINPNQSATYSHNFNDTTCSGTYKITRMDPSDIIVGLYNDTVKLKLKIAWADNNTLTGNDSNLLIVFYVQIMPDDFVMQLHRF